MVTLDSSPSKQHKLFFIEFILDFIQQMTANPKKSPVNVTTEAREQSVQNQHGARIF